MNWILKPGMGGALQWCTCTAACAAGWQPTGGWQRRLQTAQMKERAYLLKKYGTFPRLDLFLVYGSRLLSVNAALLISAQHCALDLSIKNTSLPYSPQLTCLKYLFSPCDHVKQLHFHKSDELHVHCPMRKHTAHSIYIYMNIYIYSRTKHTCSTRYSSVFTHVIVWRYLVHGGDVLLDI